MEEEGDVVLFDQTNLLTNETKSKADVHKGVKVKFLKTLALCAAFFGLGLCFAVLGPTLLDLKSHVHADISQITYIFTGRSIGYLIGSIIGGILFDKFNQLLLLSFALFVTSLATAIAPWSSHLLVLAATIGIQGLTMGFLDTGGNVLCLTLWGRKSGPFMQALHFAFGIGAFISPLIAEPFLAGNFCHNNSMTANSVLISNTPLITKDIAALSTEALVIRKREANFPNTTIENMNFIVEKNLTTDHNLNNFTGLVLNVTQTTPSYIFPSEMLLTKVLPKPKKPKPRTDGNILPLEDGGLQTWIKEKKIPQKPNTPTSTSLPPESQINFYKTNVSSVQNSNMHNNDNVSLPHNLNASLLSLADNLYKSTEMTTAIPSESNSTSGISTLKLNRSNAFQYNSVENEIGFLISTIPSSTTEFTVIHTMKDSSSILMSGRRTTRNDEESTQNTSSHATSAQKPDNTQNSTSSTHSSAAILMSTMSVGPTLVTHSSANSLTGKSLDSSSPRHLSTNNLSDKSVDSFSSTHSSSNILASDASVNSLLTNSSANTLLSSHNLNSSFLLHPSINTLGDRNVDSISPTSSSVDTLLRNTKLVSTSPIYSSVNTSRDTNVAFTLLTHSSNNTLSTTSVAFILPTLSSNNTLSNTSVAFILPSLSSNNTLGNTNVAFILPTHSNINDLNNINVPSPPTYSSGNTVLSYIGAALISPKHSNAATITNENSKGYPETTNSITNSKLADDTDKYIISLMSSVITYSTAVRSDSLYTSSSSFVIPEEHKSQKLSGSLENSHIKFAYLIIAIFIFQTSIAFLVFFGIGPHNLRVIIPEDRNNHPEHQNKSLLRIQLLILLFIFYFMYVGMEATFGGLVLTFSVCSSLQFPMAYGAYVTSLFWGAFALARGFAIYFSKFLKPSDIMRSSLILSLFASLLLAFFSEMKHWVLWVGSGLLGIGMASIFPTGLIWVEQYFAMSNKEISILVVGSALGEMILPVLTSHFFKLINPMFLMYLMVSLNLFSIIIYIIMERIAERFGDKYCFLLLNMQTGSKKHIGNIDDERIEKESLLESDLLQNSQQSFESTSPTGNKPKLRKSNKKD